jgi:hypothetical protein
MKKIAPLLILLNSLFSSSQDLVDNLNKINIPNTLTFEKEIRIYHECSVIGEYDLFRMYLNNSGKWIIEKYIYNFYKQKKTYKNRIQLKQKNDPNLVWLRILKTNILNLPNQSEFEYKIETPKIEYFNGTPELIHEVIMINDGDSYKVKIRNKKKENEVFYDNPISYLKHYPKIDEFIYFSELLNLIKNEFGIKIN